MSIIRNVNVKKTPLILSELFHLFESFVLRKSSLILSENEKNEYFFRDFFPTFVLYLRFFFFALRSYRQKKRDFFGRRLIILYFLFRSN